MKTSVVFLSSPAEKAYFNYPKYWNSQAKTKSVDPDQMLHSAASDLDLHCLPLIQQFVHTSTAIEQV